MNDKENFGKTGDASAGFGFAGMLANLRRSDRLSWRIGRFLTAGGVVAAVNLSSLYFFTEVLGLWYIASAVFAFIISVVASFTLQKFWTFRDRKTEMPVVSGQFAIYLAVTLLNLLLNIGLLYFLVEYLGVWYILGQIVVSLAIAFESFVVYGWIFRRES